MRLLHITNRNYLPSLLHRGLTPDRSKGKRKCVYLCSRARLCWALRHVSARHGWPVADLLALEVEVPRSQLRRLARGLYWTVARVEVR